MTTLSYPPSSEPLKFFIIIHQVVSDFSSFSGCLEMRTESSISLLEFVACLTRHPICPIFASLKIMPRVSITLYLHIAYGSLDSLQMTMITTNFMHVHIVYCRSLQLRMK